MIWFCPIETPLKRMKNALQNRKELFLNFKKSIERGYVIFNFNDFNAETLHS